MRSAPRWLGLLVATVLFPFSAQAWDSPILEFGSGLAGGNAYELVLRDGTYTNPVSLLVWPTWPLVTASASFEQPWIDGCSTRVTLQVAWPLMVSTVTDEDWNTGLSSNDLIYGRSEHEGYLTAHLEASVEQWFGSQDWRWALGVRTRWTSWEAWNGNGNYEYTSGATSSIEFTGAVLDYRQLWILPFAGVSHRASGPIGSWTSTFLFGPYTWAFNRDDHNYYGSESVAWIDTPRGGFFADWSNEFHMPHGTGLRVRVTAAGFGVGETLKTTTLQNSSAVYPYWAGVAGAWYWETGLEAFFRH